MGARQTGKTWLMKEFGRTSFEHTVYINFDSNTVMEDLFASDLNSDRLIMGLELYIGHKIVPENTLLIFDEIQEVPRALTSLKYFNEEAPQYNIVCAGSLLGIALHKGTSFPVGKVEFIKLYPLSFSEFLIATKRGQFADLLKKRDFQMITTFREKYIEALRQYYFIGGMSEAIQSFVDEKDYTLVRKIQDSILRSYEQDFSKHAPNELVPKIRMAWESIPSQLAKENKKFLYGLIREGARAKDFEAAIMWLIDCGLIHKISRINLTKLSSEAFENLKAYKLFLLDVGLLGCLSGLSQSALLEGNSLFEEFKGALTEQYVCQELLANDNSRLFYYSNDKNSCEIDFLLDRGKDVVPLEVKAEENLKAKSLKAYRDKFSPAVSVRTSISNYREQEWMINIPLYAIGEIDSILNAQPDGKQGDITGA